jgi:hypothetical protein
VLEELLCRQLARLPPIEDRLGDIRRKIAEADEPREIGPADPFPLSECGKRNTFALGECRVEPACPEGGRETDSLLEGAGFEPSVPPEGKQDYSRLPRSSVQDRPFGKSDRLLLQKEPGSATRRHSKEAARVRGDRPPWTDQRSAISVGDSGVTRRLA